MEKIRINSIEMKGPAKTICVVNYDNNKEATLNTKWQSQEVDFLQKDIGIGGEVEVLIVQKGQYTNITEVNFGDKPITASERIEVNPSEKREVPRANLLSAKDVSIIAQCMTKCVYYGKSDASLGKVLDTYHEACLSLEQNG